VLSDKRQRSESAIILPPGSLGGISAVWIWYATSSSVRITCFPLSTAIPRAESPLSQRSRDSSRDFVVFGDEGSPENHSSRRPQKPGPPHTRSGRFMGSKCSPGKWSDRALRPSSLPSEPPEGGQGVTPMAFMWPATITGGRVLPVPRAVDAIEATRRRSHDRVHCHRRRAGRRAAPNPFDIFDGDRLTKFGWVRHDPTSNPGPAATSRDEGPRHGDHAYLRGGPASPKARPR